MNDNNPNEDNIINFPVSAAATDVLQPLREIGSEEKTRFWDTEDIQAALREAFRLGIDPRNLPFPPAA